MNSNSMGSSKRLLSSKHVLPPPGTCHRLLTNLSTRKIYLYDYSFNVEVKRGGDRYEIKYPRLLEHTPRPPSTEERPADRPRHSKKKKKEGPTPGTIWDGISRFKQYLTRH